MGGRKPFAPTAAMRRTVRQMRSVGESERTIAAAIGIDPHTLTKHFADDLTHGLAQCRREITDLLFKSARKGNVSAQKALAQMVSVAAAEQSFTAPEDQPAKPEKLGKKEQAQRAAAVAGQGTGWGDDLEPKTVN